MTPAACIIHQARWVIPMDGPVLADGAVAVAGDRIAAVGPASELRRRYAADSAATAVVHYDHGDGAILPALVNTHLHLEFSALHRAIPPQPDLPSWLLAAINNFLALTPQQIEAGIQAGIAAARRYGTVLAAEVSTTGRSLPHLPGSGLEFHYFFECLGFDLFNQGPLEDDFPFLAQAQLDSLPVSAAGHAPYSTSAPLCQRLQAWNRQRQRPNGIHLAESREERDFLRRGDGPFRDLLVARGRWPEHYHPPGCSPAVYLDRLGFWDGPALAVHGVWLDDQDRELLARRGVWLALCPRSNVHTGAGFPAVPALLQAGVRLTLGTDSLASAPNLNLFEEIAVLLTRFPELQIPDLVAMATVHGAAALQRTADLGSLTPGKKAALLFLPLPTAAPLWPALLAAGLEGKIYWLTAAGQEGPHDA